MTSVWKLYSKSGIHWEAKFGVIAIFDEDTDAFFGVIKDLFKVSATIYSGGIGTTTNVRKTTSKSNKFVSTIFSVFC